MEKLAFQCANVMGRTFNMAHPFLDAESAELRMNFVHESIATNGVACLIRKTPAKIRLNKAKLLDEQYITEQMHDFLIKCVWGHCNILVAGETGSGKTELVKYLSSNTKENEKIISIEDTLELQIPHKHLIRMEARSVNIENEGEITIQDLVKNSLRQRPDRIIVGEVRGSEAITLFNALNTGHSGFGTLHANSSRETITRLTNAPMSVPKIMISSIDFIIMEKRIYKSNGRSIRRITEIAEVAGVEEGTIQLNKLFQWDSETDSFENLTIVSKTLAEIANLRGVSINALNKEWEKRKLV
jgi:flagellar protein FlaI